MTDAGRDVDGPGGDDETALVGRMQELELLDDALDAFVRGESVRVALSGEAGSGKTTLLHALQVRAERRGLAIVWGTGDEFGRDTPLGLIGAVLEPGGSALDPAALERAASERPLVLILDDMQWADDASLTAIARLLRRPPQGVLPVVAHRTGRVPELLLRAVGVAPPRGRIRHVELGPIAADAAAPLLRGLSAEAGRRVLAESGGNALVLTQLAAAARRGDAMPATLRAALVAELSVLSPRAGRLIAAAAVLGDPFDGGLAARIAELEPAPARLALEELLAADLVRVAAEPARCALRQPFLARVVLDWIDGPTALAVRERAALLRGEPGDRRGPASEASQSPVAGAEDAAERLRLLLDRALTLATGGNPEDARAPAAEALGLLPQVPAESRAQVMAPLARLEVLLMGPEQSMRLLSEVGDSDAAELHVTLALTRWHAYDWPGMARSARRALERVRGGQGSEQVVRVGAASLLALAEQQLGHGASAREALAEADYAVRVADLGPRPELLLHAFAAALMLERHELALSYAEQLVEIARAGGQRLFLVPALAAAAGGFLHLGDIARADRLAGQALELARDGTDPDEQLLVHAMWCRVATLRGTLADAVEHGELAAEALRQVPSARWRVLPPYALAEARLAQGDAERVIAELLAAGGGASLGRVMPTWRTRWVRLLTEAEVARGDLAAARAWSERGRAMAAPVSTVGMQAEADWALAVVLSAEGDATGAQTAARRAEAGFAEVGRRHDVTLVRRLIGGNGAARAAGSARATGTAGASGALSAREREIAELLARGSTNRQIAERLVISEKTVESHLTRIYTKLGVNTRMAAVDRLWPARIGAAEEPAA